MWRRYFRSRSVDFESRFALTVEDKTRRVPRNISKNTFVLAWKWTKNTGWHGRDERVTRGRIVGFTKREYQRDHDMASLCRMANRREKLNLVVLAARCTLFQLQWNQHLRQIRIPNILAIVSRNGGDRLKSLVLREHPRMSLLNLPRSLLPLLFKMNVPLCPVFLVSWYVIQD